MTKSAIPRQALFRGAVLRLVKENELFLLILPHLARLGFALFHLLVIDLRHLSFYLVFHAAHFSPFLFRIVAAQFIGQILAR